MENLTRKMTLILVASMLMLIGGCTGTNSTNTGADSQPNANAGPFVQGTWMDQAFVQKLKDRDFHSAWPSLSNSTGFATFLNEAGKPFWVATIPDKGGELNFREGRWCIGESPIVEFFVEGKDTLARYFETAAEFKGKGGLDHPQIYQRVPCARKPGSHLSDDWLIAADCIYFVHYFAGSYDVVDANGNRTSLELTQDGKVSGDKSWSEYGINTVNTLPIFYLGKNDNYEKFVIKGTDAGFSLAAALNAEMLEGDGNEIQQGRHVYEFVRK